MTKAKTLKPEEPKAEGDARREGKKNVRWQDDPEIMNRLVKVAELMNRGKRAFEIAVTTKVSIETARRDISRVREIWKADAKDRLAHAKDIAIAQYAAVINHAWDDAKKVTSASNPARAAYLNVILRAQRQMDSVSGIAEKHEISGPGGGPIEHSVVDIEKIRKKRWEQVSGNLADLAKKESNDESATPEVEQKSE